MSADTPPHHHGGFGKYCYILPDSWILRLPAELSNEEATPLNCGVATMVAVIEAAEIGFGDTVVIFGLGLLGLYGAALAKARGAGRVIGIDAVAARRALAIDSASTWPWARTRKPAPTAPRSAPKWRSKSAVTRLSSPAHSICCASAVTLCSAVWSIRGRASPSMPIRYYASCSPCAASTTTIRAT